jgi:hypothetical protein
MTKKPIIRSKWARVVEYPDNHLNDFCIFQDLRGKWHLMGIMGTGTWESEQSLFHCSSDDLYGPYDKHSPLLTAKPCPTSDPSSNHRPQKHAPFVVENNGMYHLFYRRPWGTILRIESDDPYTWNGPGKLVFEENDARDVCILQVSAEFYMYYCMHRVVNGVDRSCIMLRRSTDLMTWSASRIVHYDSMQPAHHSYLESPFVIAAEDGYFLFIRHLEIDDNATTVVFFSERPDSFPSGDHAWFCELHNVHAPEILVENGRYVIGRVSGTKMKSSPNKGGWIELAELGFE